MMAKWQCLTTRGWPRSSMTRVLGRYTRSDLNTRGYLDPAGNFVTGTRVPGYREY